MKTASLALNLFRRLYRLRQHDVVRTESLLSEHVIVVSSTLPQSP
jgi:hypothetical protein